MNDIPENFYNEAITKAIENFRQGNRKRARKWAQIAATLNPNEEEPWLILAALSTPQSSFKYLSRALQINPMSQRAKRGIAWAARRKAIQESQHEEINSKINISPITDNSLVKKKLVYGSWYSFFVLLTILLFLPLTYPQWAKSSIAASNAGYIHIGIDKLTRTPTFTSTPTITSTSTNIPTATFSPTYTTSPTFTATNTPIITKTPKPKNTKTSKNSIASQIAKRPKGVKENENWIDIDLSSQRAFAMKGDTLIKSFIVSTGTWQYPTVTGTFKIYVKYRSAGMSGPGYSLPNVPYVMYFYKDYGLHGTYWHKNFGTPMSHGCVNFKTTDAAWLFEFASIGTTVNIHR